MLMAPMQVRQMSRLFLSIFFIIALCGTAISQPTQGQGYVVMDARNGDILLSENADAPLHPSWLAHMMVLYLAFSALETGQVSVNSEVVASAHAAGQHPPRLGLHEGLILRFEELLAAVAMRRSTDAATAIAETLSVNVPAFVSDMNDMAAAMCLQNTFFMNPQGWIDDRQTMSVRDATILARYLIFDFPHYYPLFTQPYALAGGRRIRPTLRWDLYEIDGFDGLTTGYSRAGGYHSVYSAERDDVRIIVTVFGETSVSRRNLLAIQLLEQGFRLAEPSLETVPPDLPGCSLLLS
jgi:D-alanyl-D-alanine carboxypeptidase